MTRPGHNILTAAEGANTPTHSRRRPKVDAIILAAGQSKRMGGRNKLLQTLHGTPVVRHIVEAVLTSRARQVIAVTGHESGAVVAALAGLDVTFAHNPDFADGLSRSLACGIDAVADDTDGALVCLGDMPQIQSAHVDQLIAAFSPKDGRSICVPVHAGRRGNPVLWAADFFSDLRAIEGDTGARHLIARYADLVSEVEVWSDAIFTDVDTPEALRRLRRTD